MKTRDEIIAAHPLIAEMEARGCVIKGANGRRVTNRCALNEHKPGHLCVNVDAEKEVWYCNDCREGGSVIDFIALSDGVSPGDVLKRLGGGNDAPAPTKRAPEPATMAQRGGGRVVATYDYTDEGGRLLFQVCRFEPKDFRQKAPDGRGGWIYKLDGVRRVLYNLPKILAADFVWICEGEKDADALIKLGFVATTNCGGSKKWMPEYTAALRGKDVAILPDNDKAGAEHLETLKKALAPAVKSIRVIEMADGIKDVSDMLATYETPTAGGMALLEMAEKAEVLHQGQSVPIETMAELEERYREHAQRVYSQQLDLSAWLPGLRNRVRPLVPGELAVVLMGTGAGKTMVLQNIALNTPLASLLFEAELPGTLTFERFAAMATGTTGRHVEDSYRVNGSVDWRKGGKLDRIQCCHLSNLTPERITHIINSAQLKTSVRPVLVMIDYIQLLQAEGGDRYERTSSTAEALKRVAKDTNTIIILASQIGRSSTGTKDEPREVSLTSAKDSGSIENSAGLVIGGWRDGADPDRLWLRVLKNTKGISGVTLPCRINESLQIHEEAQDGEPDEMTPPAKPKRNFHQQ